MRSLIALIASLTIATPAFATATDWVDVAPGTRVRLIASDQVRPDGTTLIGIEADLPPGTRTYWRTPGESGIPTELDLSGSSGIGAEDILWPYPSVDRSAGVLDYVYKGHTVLPVVIEASGAGATVKAALVMGICSEICVPARAEFTLPLDFSRPDNAQALRLGQAVATTPIAWDGAPDAISDPVYDPASRSLRLEVTDPDIDPLSILAETAPGGPLIGTPQKSPESATIILPLLGSTDEMGLEGKPIHFTFMTRKGPYETVRKVSLGG